MVDFNGMQIRGTIQVTNSNGQKMSINLDDIDNNEYLFGGNMVDTANNLSSNERKIFTKLNEKLNNTITVASYKNDDGEWESGDLNLENLAKTNNSNAYIIADENGEVLCSIEKQFGEEDIIYKDKNGQILPEDSDIIKMLNSKSDGINTELTYGLQSGKYQLYVNDYGEGKNSTHFDGFKSSFTKKEITELNGVAERYYYEDDAQAFNKYESDMKKLGKSTDTERKQFELKQLSIQQELLAGRYAGGEISKEEYDIQMAKLEQQGNDIKKSLNNKGSSNISNNISGNFLMSMMQNFMKMFQRLFTNFYS